ncbi:unnamed protein product [Arctia plantaginis]|uniref:Uncharacterized protein n=1 Tax=Arctia plantaginis TaxID=874455 RepID=A0A8S0ZQN5_ARCPL|nr:unnamed protein product [Arctia plantaginis]
MASCQYCLCPIADALECTQMPRRTGCIKQKYLRRYLPIALILGFVVFTFIQVDPTNPPCPVTSSFGTRLLHVFGKPVARFISTSLNYFQQILEIVVDFFSDLCIFIKNERNCPAFKRRPKRTPKIMRICSDTQNKGKGSNSSIFTSCSSSSCPEKTVNTALLKSKTFRRHNKV